MTDRILGPRGEKRRRRFLFLLPLVAIAALALSLSAAAMHQRSSGRAAAATTCATASTLAGSNFEIDAASGAGTRTSPFTGGANLKRDGASPCIDWQTTKGTSADLFAAGVAKRDKASGSGDDSFGQGTSENDANPVIVSGSIPPNKSDLLAFGAYKETTASGKFLDLFWQRVNGPTGTTVMDFELNKKSCSGVYTDTVNCAVNSHSDGDPANPGHPLAEVPVRSSGDKLISFVFSGSSTPTVCKYNWNGSSWDQPGVQISSGTNSGICGTGATQDTGQALGSINFSPIASTDTYGLGDLTALTFGEVSVNFNEIFSGISGCTTFGSLHLTTRSSATFTDELKDFIAPLPVTITNCTSLTTSASNQSTAKTVGGAISDTATLSNALSPTNPVVFKAYGPFDPTTAVGNDTCVDSGAGANLVFGPTNGLLSGPDTSGNYSATASFTPAAAGRYEWVASYAADGNNAASNTKCGDANEQSLVGPVQPSISTTASAPPGSAVSLGTALDDTAHLSGTALEPDGVTKAQGTITFNLYGPFSAANICTGSPVGTSVVSTVNGNGDYTASSGTITGTLTPTAAGTYNWVASYGGDLPNTKSVSGSCSDSTEASVVKPNTPLISTSASASVTIGTAIDDTATLTGTALEPDGVTKAQGTITFTLYGPSLSPDCTTAIATRVVNVNGDGSSYTASSGTGSGSLTPSVVGTYYWKAVYSGDPPNTNGAATSCGDTGESSVVNPASPTLASSPTLTPQDSATLSGIVSGGTPQATITFSLYPPSDTTCTGVPKYTQTQNVTGDATYTTSNSTFTLDHASATGIYRWKVTYSGDSKNNTNSKACGVEKFDFEGITESAAS